MRYITLIFIFIQLSLNAQSDDFLLILDCNDFAQNISANKRMNVDFINLERYNSLKNDTLVKQKKILTENFELTKSFEKNFPNKISKHCVNSKMYEKDSIRNLSFCNDNYKIKLIEKKFNFYIFKLDAFEINSYLLFDTKSQIIYTINNYPQIIKEGKIILDFGYEYEGQNAFNFYFIEDKDISYFEYRIPNQYQIRDYKILNSGINNPKILVHLIKYGYKEVPNKKELGTKYEYDKEKFCEKIIMFN